MLSLHSCPVGGAFRGARSAQPFFLNRQNTPALYVAFGADLEVVVVQPDRWAQVGIHPEPDYFSYVAGGLKMFFDDWYINAKGSNDKLKNKPYGLFFSHGGGGKVLTSLEDLAKHVGAKAAETVGSQGTPTNETLEKCRRLGEKMGKKAL